MNYPEIIINDLSWKLIPLGECACGCGGKTNLARQTDHKRRDVKGQPVRYINGHQWQGSENPGWNGGKSRKRIYDLVLMPGHPRADYYGYVRKHLLIAEKALGRPIPKKHPVHHHSPTQLVICESHAYHQLLDQRLRAFKACGHAKWRKCWICKKYDDPGNLIINGKKGNNVYHPSCQREYDRQRPKRSRHPNRHPTPRC